MKPHSLLGKFLIWRIKHIKQQHFVLILSILVGFFTGIIAVILKNSVFLIQDFLQNGILKNYYYQLHFIYPIIGLVIVSWITIYVLNKPSIRGIPSILYSISKKNGNMEKRSIYSTILLSVITVGFGGSAGLEASAAESGSSLGSNLGRVFHLNYKTRILLIGCAAAGTIASIFKAPIAAVVFAIEVIMLDLTMSSIIPLLLASVSAAITSRFFLGNDILIHFNLVDVFVIKDLPFYICLGIFGGIVSIYFKKIYFLITDFFRQFSSLILKLFFGGSILALLIWLLPPLFGEGYETINILLSNDTSSLFEQSPLNTLFSEKIIFFYLFLFFLLLGKIIATTITINAGGAGGVFASALYMGSFVGFIFSKIFNSFGLYQVSISNFTLVGMASLIAGVLHAPLTAIFLIAEMTGGYELFLPLMITTSITFITVSLFSKNSVYTKELAQKKQLITHHKDKAILTRMELSKVVESNFNIISSEMNLGDLVKVVSKSKRNLFPVTDNENKMIGVITLDDIRNIMFDSNQYKTTDVKSLMNAPPDIILTTDSMESVVEKFKTSGAWNLPVIKNGKYIGFVSKSKLFSSYRRLLLEVTED